jgi:acyl carrier protein
LLQAFVRESVGAVLGLPNTFVLEPQKGLRDLGIDSLMSIELRNRLQARISRPLPSTLVFDHPTLSALTEFVAQVLGLDLAEPGVSPAVADERARRSQQVAAVDALSDEEAEALRLEELTRKGGGHAV